MDKGIVQQRSDESPGGRSRNEDGQRNSSTEIRRVTWGGDQEMNMDKGIVQTEIS